MGNFGQWGQPLIQPFRVSSKIFTYADMPLVLFASKAIGGRPVKFVESRREYYQATTHGRDHVTYLEVGANRQGEVQGLRVKTFANLGGRLSTIGPGTPTTLYGRMLGGPYKIPNVYAAVTGVYTNTVFTDAYRGAGRPEATYVLERAMDLLADELGIDPAEIRRRNFLPPDVFPWENPSGLTTAVNGAKIARKAAGVLTPVFVQVTVETTGTLLVGVLMGINGFFPFQTHLLRNKSVVQ